jgi:thiol-disulfide isomerase/thioredoxin
VGCQSENARLSNSASSSDQQATANSVELGQTPANQLAAASSGTQVAAAATEKTLLASPISISLTAGDQSSKLAPRYSPPGKGLQLKPYTTATELGFDGLETEVILGAPAEKQAPLKLLVTRAAADAPYTRLLIDSDGNGKFDEPAIEAKLSDSRGKIWSNFDATLQVKHFGDVVTTEEYPVVFWLTVAAATDLPDVLRMSRRGFKTGEAVLAGTAITVILSDSNNDAIFSDGDWWEIRSVDGQAKNSDMRRVGDFAWLGDSAFKLELDNSFGGSARLVAVDPGITPEEDALARDPYAADKKAAKAATPLEFRHDVDAAMAAASAKQLPCFIKFETSWCGPCKTMTQFVFTAQDVTDAAAGIVCVMIDGDERKDLVERFNIKGYPTGLMIAADGTETARFVGYQNVKQMAAFLNDNKARP